MDKESKLHHRCRIEIKLRGYAALIIVLMVSVMLLVIGVSVAIISINQGQMSTIEQKKEAELAFVESCAVDALMRLNITNTIPSSFTLPQGTCNVGSTNSGTSWTITVTGNQENYTKTIQINASKTSNITITSWIEI